jgi:hypothetical protein
MTGMKEAIIMTKNSSAKKEPTDWTILYCNDMEEVRAAIEDKEFVFPQILTGIKKMLDENRTSNMVTEIWCIEALSSIWISVTLEESLSSLKLMMEWHLSREEYEECSEVQKVIDRVEQRLRQQTASEELTRSRRSRK